VNAPITEGQILAGKYRVERVLGQGGMGVVVAAVHQQLQQRVAIKFLLAWNDAGAIQRFLREARAAVRLKSEHVARVLDVAELEDGTPYIVMEYLEGVDLSQALRQGGPFPIEQAVTHMLQVCEAIAEAHAAGIIHRDLKPANLFLTTAADGSQTVKVLDFGISKASLGALEGEPMDQPPDMGLTATQTVLGSPLYMSPEQMRSSRSVDVRTDVWSMGAILYKLVTDRVPFDATSFPDLVLRVGNEEPLPPRVFRPDLPEELEAAILGCLRKRLGDRFANVGEFAQAIAPFAPEEARVSVPRILRTLGLSAMSPSGRPPSRPSFASLGGPVLFVPPVGPGESTRPMRSSSGDTTQRADAPPFVVAPMTHSPVEFGNAPAAPSPSVARWPAPEPSTGAAALRGRTKLILAFLMVFVTVGGGAIALSWLRAQPDELVKATEETSPVLQPASRPPAEVVQATAVTPSVVAVEPAPVATASSAPAARPSVAARPAHAPDAATPRSAPPPKVTAQASAAASTSQSPLERMNQKGLQ
jgi:eukaryotic-like serine/threonine-protein kinase